MMIRRIISDRSDKIIKIAIGKGIFYNCTTLLCSIRLNQFLNNNQLNWIFYFIRIFFYNNLNIILKISLYLNLQFLINYAQFSYNYNKYKNNYQNLWFQNMYVFKIINSNIMKHFVFIFLNLDKGNEWNFHQFF